MKLLIYSIIGLCLFACGKKETLPQQQPIPAKELCGCMDTAALNFDSKATKNDSTVCKYQWQEWVGEWAVKQTTIYHHAMGGYNTDYTEYCVLQISKIDGNKIELLAKADCIDPFQSSEKVTFDGKKMRLALNPIYYPDSPYSLTANLSIMADTIYFSWRNYRGHRGGGQDYTAANGYAVRKKE